MTLRWFTSSTVRHTMEMCRQMTRVINEQRDLLSPQAIADLQKSRDQANASARSNASVEELKNRMNQMEEAAHKWFKPYAFPAVRENVKEFLVAVVTILAFTTYFLQLTKIPTGSMQPTLFGIITNDLRGQRDLKVPGFLPSLWEYWVHGISYKYWVAPFDGQILEIQAPKTVFPFVKKQHFVFGNGSQRIGKDFWFVPDNFDSKARLQEGMEFKSGEEIVKMQVVAGDHLLVDRFTYNFRHPERGEIIVFKTRGITGITDQDVLYIKRLIGLPEETIRIGNDRHVVVNGKRLDATTRHFEDVYTEDKSGQPFPYLGHVNETVAQQVFNIRVGLAPNFLTERSEFKIRPGHYLAMGDNTLNSADSRTWGDLPQQNVIGKCWFVYWPISHRFGWNYR